MSQHDLRDLLHERVADETAVDLTPGAWRAGQRARRRRTLGVVAGVTVTAAAVSGAVAVVDSTAPGTDDPPAPAASTPPSTVAPEPPQPRPAGDAEYRGTPVWFSPDQVEERDLPYVEDGPFPETLDLDVRSKALVGPALAAFGIGGGRVAIVGAENSVVTIDVSGFGGVTKPNGYRLSSVTSRMLSPSGSHLLFPEDGALQVYDIGGGSWTRIDTDLMAAYATWLDDDTIAVPASPTGGPAALLSVTGEDLGTGTVPWLEPAFDERTATAYGSTVGTRRSQAQAWGMGVTDLPVRDPGRDRPEPEFLAVQTPSVSGALAMMTTHTPDDSRSKQCCPVAGWLDDDTLVYESRQAEPMLMAWTIGTDEFRRVTTIEGAFSFASFADLG